MANEMYFYIITKQEKRKKQTKRFSLYELILINHGCQSYELQTLNLILLMYADDTVVFSENVEDLQNKIDSISTIANDHGLYVTLSKNKNCSIQKQR